MPWQKKHNRDMVVAPTVKRDIFYLCIVILASTASFGYFGIFIYTPSTGSSLRVKFPILANMKMDASKASKRVKQMQGLSSERLNGEDWTFDNNLGDQMKDFERKNRKELPGDQSKFDPSSVRLDQSYFESFDSSSTSVLFAHVPKTAGSSVQVLLKSWGKANGIVTKSHIGRADLIKSAGSKADIKIFETHRVWWQYNNAIDEEQKAGEDIDEPLKITVLREPLKQFISLHDYILNEPKHKKHKAFRKIFGGGTLESHLNKMLIEFEQGGFSSFSKVSRVLYDQLHNQLFFLAGTQHGSPLNSKEDLIEKYRMALTNLETFHVVATQESLDSSLLPQLKYWLPWADQGAQNMPHVNKLKASKKSVISDDIAKWLNENLLVYDNKLYERAKEIEHDRLHLVSKLTIS